jgi:hypothetical protein
MSKAWQAYTMHVLDAIAKIRWIEQRGNIKALLDFSGTTVVRDNAAVSEGVGAALITLKTLFTHKYIHIALP